MRHSNSIRAHESFKSEQALIQALMRHFNKSRAHEPFKPEQRSSRHHTFAGAPACRRLLHHHTVLTRAQHPAAAAAAAAVSCRAWTPKQWMPAAGSLAQSSADLPLNAPRVPPPLPVAGSTIHPTHLCLSQSQVRSCNLSKHKQARRARALLLFQKAAQERKYSALQEHLPPPDKEGNALAAPLLSIASALMRPEANIGRATSAFVPSESSTCRGTARASLPSEWGTARVARAGAVICYRGDTQAGVEGRGDET
eukprot:1138987-Pelagomonas_calceolata.AAC.7